MLLCHCRHFIGQFLQGAFLAFQREFLLIASLRFDVHNQVTQSPEFIKGQVTVVLLVVRCQNFRRHLQGRAFIGFLLLNPCVDCRQFQFQAFGFGQAWAKIIFIQDVPDFLMVGRINARLLALRRLLVQLLEPLQSFVHFLACITRHAVKVLVQNLAAFQRYGSGDDNDLAAFSGAGFIFKASFTNGLAVCLRRFQRGAVEFVRRNGVVNGGAANGDFSGLLKVAVLRNLPADFFRHGLQFNHCHVRRFSHDHFQGFALNRAVI